MKPGEEGSTPATERGNARRWSHIKILRKGISVDEVAPVGWNGGIGPLEHHAAMWAVLMPPGVTSYTLKVWKLVGVYRPGGAAVVEEWVLEATYAGLTASVLKYQPVDGCRICATIEDIVVGGGGIGDGFTVTYNGINRGL